ncbi:MAG: recombinase [Thermoleophilia bacterium]|nr:recombinase [Thermoleophilia bacterium]
MAPVVGTRVAIYARVSTPDQARSGLSLDLQLRRMRAHCEAHGYTVVEEIREEGHSAKSLDRPGMDLVRHLLREAAVEAVVVYKLDRLTRSVADFAKLLEEFEAAGVSFEAVVDRLDTSSPSGRLVVNIMLSVAQWEREEAASRTKEALGQAKARGVFLGKPPVGWRVQAGRLVPGERIEVVEMVHALRDRGLTLHEIAVRLNEDEVPTKTGRGPWRKNTVARALRAPRVGQFVEAAQAPGALDMKSKLRSIGVPAGRASGGR